MKQSFRKGLFLSVLLILLIFTGFLIYFFKPLIEDVSDESLSKVYDQKLLTVSVENNALDYFIYRGHVLGFEYELLEAFAKELGVKLRIKTGNNPEEHLTWLENQEVDLVAANFCSHQEEVEDFLLSVPIKKDTHCKESAWLFRKSSDSLQKLANVWLQKYMKTKEFKGLHYRYYLASRKTNYEQNKETLENGKISKYDELIKKHAAKIGWDWQLLAALIYQESQFKSNKVSWAGAFGIMQMMPNTAKRYEINDSSSIEDQIRAGAAYLKKLDDILPKEIEDPEQRIKFVLASYNSGIGHVLDARRLCLKYGENPNIWALHTEKYMRLKSNPIYYNDEVVSCGYARGKQTFDFVRDTYGRYLHYKNLVP